jgi:hypothetical protein
VVLWPPHCCLFLKTTNLNGIYWISNHSDKGKEMNMPELNRQLIERGRGRELELELGCEHGLQHEHERLTTDNWTERERGLQCEINNQYCSDCLHVHLLCYSGNNSLGEPLLYLWSTISLTWANSIYIIVHFMQQAREVCYHCKNSVFFSKILNYYSIFLNVKKNSI